MAYQVLARKWRPQDFSSVVGQDAIVTALRNALSERRIAQAYLFSGIRGVGKTSVARVFAKALNCEHGPAPDPCNDCTTCREITSGADLDVLEIDAATYSKVEQVRELTESLKYGPARDRYKVVVIDEIHRLSRQAFDALLKIVEEPPPHLVFLFATTESEAVPATVLSRCQEFQFRRVPVAALADHLRAIARAEEIEASDTALRLVARAGEGSVRDAVALLDQLATFGGGRIPEEEASRVLGGVDAAVHHRALGAMLASDGAALAGLVAEADEQGWDPRKIFSEFLAYCRDGLHLALGAEPDQIDLPEDESTALAELAHSAGYENLLRLLNQLLASEQVVRRSETGSLALEIAWLRAAELPKLTRIEELLRGGGPGGEAPRASAPATKPVSARSTAPSNPRSGPRSSAPSNPRSSAPPNPRSTARPNSRSTARSRKAAAPDDEASPVAPRSSGESAAPPARPAAARETKEPEPALSPGPPAAKPATPGADVAARDQPGDPVGRFLDEVSKAKQPLAAHLAEARSLVFEEGRLRIVTAPGDNWLGTALARGNNRAVLESCLAAVWGKGSGWRLVEGSADDLLAEKTGPAPTHPALRHPTVQTALDIFGGTATVEETPS